MALCHKNVGGQWSNAWKAWKTLRPIEYVAGLRVCIILPDDESKIRFRNAICF